MRLKSGQAESLGDIADDVVGICLYTNPGIERAAAGRQLLRQVLRRKLSVVDRAWDFLTFALSVVSADHVCVRRKSPDGWTREIDLEIAVVEPDFWNSQAGTLASALRFLTTDIWHLVFVPGGKAAPRQERIEVPSADSVTLLSGGLDSLIGVVDRWSAGAETFAVSQTVRGDGAKQVDFARKTCGLSNFLQLNHGVKVWGGREPSQRARSVGFMAFAVAVATAVSGYRQGGTTPVYVCENGFIAINPPLTPARIGGLSTRTAHPSFISNIQSVLDSAGLNVKLTNPYAEMTKGEMLAGCLDQDLIRAEAHRSTSCSRFLRYGYQHCGRCVPCQVRRASFVRWDVEDLTPYCYDDLGVDDGDHAGFDDVRAVAMALETIRRWGFDYWLGGALEYGNIDPNSELRQMVSRGMSELKGLHQMYDVK